jgi:RNA polymerase sigma-70 factor (ECF subfamily)
LHTGPSTPNPEEALILSESQRRLKRAVDDLDDKHRLPVLLRYQHGLSVPEIAHALELSEGTVYSRLHYAHRKLRQSYGLAGEPGTPEEEAV